MINLFTQIKAVVDQATELWREANDGKGKEGWIVFFEARSFWLAVIGVVFAGFATFGFPLPVPEEFVIETVTQVISFVAFAWSFIERLKGKKEIVWNTTQANSAIKQAEAVSKQAKAVKQTIDAVKSIIKKG